MSFGHISSYSASQSHVSLLNGATSAAVSADKAAAAAAAKKELVWSEQAIWTLLDVYEEKWRQLDWGNLKGRHWEEVAASLAAYSNGRWPSKTVMQCKNKIEDMKKKYKEKLIKGAGDVVPSKWPYFNRLDLMFKNAAKSATGGGVDSGGVRSPNARGIDAGACSEQANLISPTLGCHGFEEKNVFEEELDGGNADEDEDEDDESEDEDFSFSNHFQAPMKNDGEALNSNSKRKASDMPGQNNSSKHRKASSSGANDAVSLIRSLGELLVQIQSARLEGQRQLMHMRAQAENRRMEMEMKRTEMLLNAQLHLAKMISEKQNSSSSLDDTSD